MTLYRSYTSSASAFAGRQFRRIIEKRLIVYLVDVLPNSNFGYTSSQGRKLKGHVMLSVLVRDVFRQYLKFAYEAHPEQPKMFYLANNLLNAFTLVERKKQSDKIVLVV